MTNELIYFLIVLIDLSIALLAFRKGKNWLITYIVINLILVTSLAGKTVEIFGFATTIAGPFYAAVFLATDSLTEHFGKKIGYQSVFIGLSAQFLFIGLAQLSLLISPADFSIELHDSMSTVFGTSLRIFLASIIAYVISQNFDVWFYHFLQEKFGRKSLWLRNNISTITSQLLDSAIFFSIGFIGVIPNWIEVAIIGALAKIVVALLDTPFIYLTYQIKKMTNQNIET